MQLPSAKVLKQLKISPEVARYMIDRRIPLPTTPPHIQTPSPGNLKGSRFDPARVDRVMQAFAAMRHTQGELAGKPLRPDPWQVAYILAPVFGWVKQTESGKWVRIVRKLFVDIPRKNGKTTLCGGLTLYLLAADGEAGAQVYAAATKRDQASKLFDPVKQIVMQSPSLRKHLVPRQGKILHPSSGSYFKVEANDADGLHGANVHGSVVDELHLHKNPELVQALETGVGSRLQPLNVSITTADDGKAETIYANRRALIESLSRGTLEDFAHYGVIWCADEKDDPFAESTWIKANPGYPISPTRDFMQGKATEAKNSPSEFAEFQRLHLGIRTRQQTRWFEMIDWNNETASQPFDETTLEGRWCYGGLDLAFTDDLCALAWVFPKDDGVTHDVIWRLWTPEANIRRLDKVTAGAASVWVREGLLRTTPGNVADYDRIQADILEDADRFAVNDIAYDRYGATQLINNLTNAGVSMTPIGAGWVTMSPLCKELQRQIRLTHIHHGGNAAVRWQADNFAVHIDPQGNVKPDRVAVRAAKGKMDAIVALIMAYDAVMRKPAEVDFESMEWI